MENYIDQAERVIKIYLRDNILIKINVKGIDDLVQSTMMIKIQILFRPPK